MTTEILTGLIGAIVMCLGNIAALAKVWSEVAKQKLDRIRTKEERDRDSTELHDKVLKHDFMIAQLKDQQSLTATVVDDLRDQCATLNINIVKLDTNIANLTEAVRELKQ